MDTLYIGDIPIQYHYAIFSDNHIDLYNTDTLQGNLTFYRLYNYDNFFAYDVRQANYNIGYNQIPININVTDNWIYRKDFPSILTIVFFFSIFFILLFNSFTSIIKKGGLLNGLL